MPLIAKVAVEAAIYAIDKPYDYLAPEELDVRVGSRVLVPFGRGNRTSEGVVLAMSEAVPERAIKAIRQNLDPEPILREKDLKLALWMVKRYFCTFYEALHTILPAAVWYRYREWWTASEGAEVPEANEREQSLFRFLQECERETEQVKTAFGDEGVSRLYQWESLGLLERRTDGKAKVQDKVVSYVRLAMAEEEALEAAAVQGKRGPRMADAIRFLAQNGDRLQWRNPTDITIQ